MNDAQQETNRDNLDIAMTEIIKKELKLIRREQYESSKVIFEGMKGRL